MKNSLITLMGIIRLMKLTLLTVAILISCVTKTDAAKWPEPSHNFVPKLTYQVSYDKLWRAALEALDNNRIAALSADKTLGIIQTDFIEGFSFHINLIFSKGGNDSQYKYNLKLKEQSDGSVKLNIVCKIEISSYSEKGGTGWHEEGSRPALNKQLETWLYEQIEKELASGVDAGKTPEKAISATQIANDTGAEVLNNDSIVKLVKAGMSEETVVSMIKTQPTRFDVRVNEILALKTNGISDKIINEMVLRGKEASIPAMPVVTETNTMSMTNSSAH